MNATATPISYPTSASGSLHLKTLVLMRWVAIAGQCAALFSANHFFALSVNPSIPLCIIGASILFNLVSHFLMRSRKYLKDSEAAITLAFDLLQLTSLLFFTGGLSNPFVLLLVAPLAVAAATLSGRSVIIITILGLASLSALYFGNQYSLWPQPLPPLFYSGEYLALMVSSLFLVLYMRRVARESRRLGDALNQSWMQLEREQKISAFGALAAALAHELGSPLGTIAVITRELSHRIKDKENITDIALLESEISRCKQILTDLGQSHNIHDDTGLRLSLSEYIERTSAPYKRKDVDLFIQSNLDHTQEPVWPWHPVLVHGIGNIIQNAYSFAKEKIVVTLNTKGNDVQITIADDGSGFPKDILSRIGRAYTSGRPAEQKEGHMGLGLFIAKTLLERSGADVTFANNTETTGARITILWKTSPSL